MVVAFFMAVAVAVVMAGEAILLAVKLDQARCDLKISESQRAAAVANCRQLRQEIQENAEWRERLMDVVSRN